MEKRYYKSIALTLSVLLGILGVDRFYLGYTKMGVLKRLTLGCFGVLYVVDIIHISTGELKPADGSEYSKGIQLNTGMPLRDRIRLNNAEYKVKRGMITWDEYDEIKKSIGK